MELCHTTLCYHAINAHPKLRLHGFEPRLTCLRRKDNLLDQMSCYGAILKDGFASKPTPGCLSSSPASHLSHELGALAVRTGLFPSVTTDVSLSPVCPPS